MARAHLGDALRKFTDQHRCLDTCESEADRLLLRWLADGRLQANAHQIVWKRSTGAFGEGKAGNRFLVDSAGNALAGPVYVIPQQFWLQWLSAHESAKSITEYRHFDHENPVYVVADEDPAKPLDTSFIATDFKLAASGQGEIYRVVVVARDALVRLIMALSQDPGVGAKARRKPGPAPRADWTELGNDVLQALGGTAPEASIDVFRDELKKSLERAASGVAIADSTLSRKASELRRASRQAAGLPKGRSERRSRRPPARNV